MKKFIVLSAIAVLTACGGSDNKPANDPTTSAPATASTDSAANPETPSTETPAPASTDSAAAPAGEPEKK